ncbi:trypsin-like peptidase domain-containing protein [Marine Group I thaumarchaeote]|uniref:Trypsin-like peptidase domain-containing protein n=1 Tax=Marine Group I thaumarchaeote TaxID=2511932 RepID=A0A7K4MY87_9ARCH|nr:trypsin-like peptidase domain-containing protein [Marine Group I thaumarchaeote]
MAKSGFVVGGIVGATAIILLFAFIIVPSQEIGTPDLITSNGHSATILGDEISSSSKSNLTLVELFEKSEEGVVKIKVVRIGSQGTVQGDIGGVGSGFVYDNLGHIITNAHVVDGADKATVTFLDGSQYNAEIIGKDKFTDIAVIKVSEKPRLLHPLEIGDSSLLQVGEQVAAIGNPFGLSGSMTSGIVSQIGRLIAAQDSGFSIPDVIQTDAAINPGNSGGPLLNMRGQVIGINTAIQSISGEFVGIGFAVPSNTVSKIVPTLIEEGKYPHPWIGISGKDIDPDLARVLDLKQAKGFLVITVVDDSPADKAGLKGMSQTQIINGEEYPADGDIIIWVDDKEVRKISDILIHLQREKSVGDEMVLGILRDGDFMHLTLKLVERPDL